MHCPFCAEEIKDQALVCRHCHRDLTIPRPVLERVEALSKRLDALEGAAAGEWEKRLAALEETVARLETAAPASAPTADATAALPPPDEPVKRPLLGWLVRLLAAILVPVVALVVAHWLVVIVFDLRTWVIRTLSLVLPFPFGLSPIARARNQLPVQMAIGAVVAVAAVAAMSAVTGLIDNQPILPQDGRDWREVIEYAFSIWLSYTTGALVSEVFGGGAGSERATRSRVRRLAKTLASATAPENETRAELEKRIQTMATTIGTMVPLVTGAVSVISGLRKLWE